MRFLRNKTPRRLLILGVTLAGFTMLLRQAALSSGREPEVRTATHGQVMEAIKKPGARAVLVNVWATWCEPCMEEMPDILRFYKERKRRGLRLVLVSADPQEDRVRVARHLASLGVDFPSFLKTGDDMAFIDGLDPRWDGTLPASLLFDGQGQRRHLWKGQVSYTALAAKLDEVLAAKPQTPEPRRKP
jgi:thiol-disulfide isomerase/thioredoxin